MFKNVLDKSRAFGVVFEHVQINQGLCDSTNFRSDPSTNPEDGTRDVSAAGDGSGDHAGDRQGSGSGPRGGLLLLSKQRSDRAGLLRQRAGGAPGAGRGADDGRLTQSGATVANCISQQAG